MIFHTNSLGYFYTRIKHWIKLTILLFICFHPVASMGKAQPFFDIYRTHQISAKEVNKKFKKELVEMRTLLKLISSGKMDPTRGNRIDQIIREITSAIHSMGDFEYVKVNMHIYPDKKIHITADVVDKKDKQRISIFPKVPRNKSFADPDNLFQQWKNYSDIGLKLIHVENRKFNPVRCSVHHCIYGFNEKELKPYQKIFDTLVLKNKQKLIQILREDKDEEKRTLAAFLMAHLPSRQEVADILTPSLNDESHWVRGAVMRVFSAMLESKKVNLNLPVKQIFARLDSPSMEERHKALNMVYSLTQQPSYADYARKQYSQNLIALLKLHQPDQSDPAYAILKQISGKNFAQRDYQSWEQWAKSIQDPS